MLKPLADRVLIEPIEEEAITKSGIKIAFQYAPIPVKGRIVAMGPGRLTKKGVLLPHVAEKGDVVIFPQRTGDEVSIDGQPYIIVREDDLVAKWDPNGSQ